MTSLSHAELRRYSRHLLLPEVGLRGQEKLKSASVLLVGAGGLGSPCAMYLAAAGIGKLGIVDYDVVDESNLQRQVIHGQRTVGQRKVDSARDRLLDINAHIEVISHDTLLDSYTAMSIFEQYDIIADGTDNFPTRYLINDACVLLKKPNLYASIFRFEGHIAVFDAQRGPCYRCLYPEPPPPDLVPSCAEGGVLGILPGVVGCLQATEVVKYILGLGRSLVGRMLVFEALSMQFNELHIRKDPDCAVCGPDPKIRALIDYEQFCGTTIRESGSGDEDTEISPRQLQARMAEGKVVLLDIRQPHEWEISKIEGARLIALDNLPEHLHEFDSAEDIVVYCRVGGASKRAVSIFRDAGFTRVKNLRGGINAWSQQIDPTLPIY